MATQTTNLHLSKPAYSDAADIAVINSNMDIIDEAVTEIQNDVETLDSAAIKAVNDIAPDTDGNVDINTVDFANNLVADDAQASFGEFIARTTGGDASLSDGDAWLSRVRGGRVHTGYVAESINMTVTAAEREAQEGQASDTIQATLNRDTFVAAASSSGTYTFTYTTEWSLDPATYGITVTGTPIEGDVITVVYVAEVRGTITMASPTAFVSTGWNLYNNSTGYARAIKYSDTYGFKIGGTYTAVQFSSTLSGTKTTITPVDGAFNITEDGYIWVSGGNSTDTYVYMTWSDWTSGYDGSFVAYNESTISLSSVMSNFSYGLCQVGTVRDEIDLNLGVATSNVDRMTYTAANLATAKASGRAYEYDTNYIYIVRAEPITYSFTLDGAYTAADHGIEFFTGTSVACYANMFYGQNLKDKLRTDVVTISAQSLSSSQQSQVRTNIAAASQADLTTLSDHIATLHGRVRRNITSNLANLPTAVSQQDLEKYGYRIGDYFTGPSGYTYHLADMNTAYGGYSYYGVVNTNHIGIVVDAHTDVQWNTSNDTSTGYANSNLHTYLRGTMLDNIKSDMISLFGGSTGLEHLIARNMLFSTGLATWSWDRDIAALGSASYIAALTSVQLHGSPICDYDWHHTGEGNKPLELFQKFYYPEIFPWRYVWLRSVASASCPCHAGIGGTAYGDDAASNSRGAVGLILFH